MMLDEDEMQRRELKRLLTTAQDEERKEMVRKALDALGSHEKVIVNSRYDNLNPHTSAPGTQSSIFGSGGLPILETRNARMRPVSARRPSMSNLLDSIPESLHTSKNKEIELPTEEIAEIVSSSYDPRCPAEVLFKPTSNTASLHGSPNHNPSFSVPPLTHSPSVSSIPEHSTAVETPIHTAYSSVYSAYTPVSASLALSLSARRQWVSTGLVPQFLSVSFYEQWLVRKVEVRCRGVERISVHINFSSASSFSPAKLIPLVKKSDDRFEAEVIRPKSSDIAGSSDERVGAHGKGLLIVVQQTNSLFCSISQIRIIVCPQNR